MAVGGPLASTAARCRARSGVTSGEGVDADRTADATWSPSHRRLALRAGVGADQRAVIRVASVQRLTRRAHHVPRRSDTVYVTVSAAPREAGETSFA